MVQSAVHGDHITLVRNHHFTWGLRGAPVKLPKQLVLKIVTNETTAASLLITGGLDLGYVTGPGVARLEAQATLTHRTAQAYQVAWLAMYQGAGHPTADPVVRQAIATIVDRHAWNQAANSGRGAVGDGLQSSQAQCYDAANASLIPTPSITHAQSLLESDGYKLVGGKLEKNGTQLRIHLLGPTTTNAGPEYIATVLKQAGINVTLTYEDYTAFVHDLVTANFDAAVVPSAVDFPWPTDAIVFWHGAPLPKGFNLFGVKDSALEKDVLAATESSGTDQCGLWNTVEQRLLTQHDFLPLASAQTNWFSRNLNFTPGAIVINPLTFS